MTRQAVIEPSVRATRANMQHRLVHCNSVQIANETLNALFDIVNST